jgi:PST family polysaccharide transporter
VGVGTVGTRQIAEASSKDDLHALAVARRAIFWGALLLAGVGALVVWSLRVVLAVMVLGSESRSGVVAWLSLVVALSVAAGSQGALIRGMRRIGDLARLNVSGATVNTVLGVGLIWRWGNAGLVAYVLLDLAYSR